jgi:hypothetical protein
MTFNTVAADLRARQTLMRYLTEEQKTTLKAHGYFDVLSVTGRTYRIKCRGRLGNVNQINPDTGKFIRHYCFGLADVVGDALGSARMVDYPIADTWLMQAMMCRCNEWKMWRISNT